MAQAFKRQNVLYVRSAAYTWQWCKKKGGTVAALDQIRYVENVP